MCERSQQSFCVCISFCLKETATTFFCIFYSHNTKVIVSYVNLPCVSRSAPRHKFAPTHRCSRKPVMIFIASRAMFSRLVFATGAYILWRNRCFPGRRRRRNRVMSSLLSRLGAHVEEHLECQLCVLGEAGAFRKRSYPNGKILLKTITSGSA